MEETHPGGVAQRVARWDGWRPHAYVGRSKTHCGAADPLARIEALEQHVTKLHAEQQAAVDALRDRMTESDHLLGQRIANLANDVYRARDEDRAALDESLARQKLYTGMFVVGTVLATVASVYG
jgi:hypothetical protein